MLRDVSVVAQLWQHKRTTFLAVHYWLMFDCNLSSFASHLRSLQSASESDGRQTDSESTATDRVRRVRWSISIIVYRNSRQRSRRVGANRSRHIDNARRRRIVRWRQLRIWTGATHDRAFDTATSTAHYVNSSTISRSFSRLQSLLQLTFAPLFHTHIYNLDNSGSHRLNNRLQLNCLYNKLYNRQSTRNSITSNNIILE